jgi:hypothetical protein
MNTSDSHFRYNRYIRYNRICRLYFGTYQTVKTVSLAGTSRSEPPLRISPKPLRDGAGIEPDGTGDAEVRNPLSGDEFVDLLARDAK